MGQLTPIRGFVNTPIIKLICILTSVITVGVSVFQLKHLFSLSIDPFIVEYHQYWRLALFQLSFINESDFLLGIILWFQFKVLERFYGTRKFLSVIVLFWLYNGVITLLVMGLGQLVINVLDFMVLKAFGLDNYKFFDTFLNTITAGPIGLLSSLYVCYGWYIPISYEYEILLGKKPENSETTEPSSDTKTAKSIRLTDHFQLHALYTIFLLNNGVTSLIPGLIGLFIGRLYVSDLLPGKPWLIPVGVFRFIINPVSTVLRSFDTLRSWFSGYQSIQEPIEQVNEQVDYDNEPEDEAINEIRAETPVRPLASQFLNTFRNTT